MLSVEKDINIQTTISSFLKKRAFFFSSVLNMRYVFLISPWLIQPLNQLGGNTPLFQWKIKRLLTEIHILIFWKSELLFTGMLQKYIKVVINDSFKDEGYLKSGKE